MSTLEAVELVDGLYRRAYGTGTVTLGQGVTVTEKPGA